MRHTFVLVSGLAVAAATPAAAQVSIGLKAGLTFATLSETDLSPDFKNQTGFAAGFHLGIPLGGSSFMFQPEALISQQGTKIQEGGTEAELELSYLIIPANLRLNIPTPGIRPYVFGGPYAAFKLSCNLDQLADCDELDLSGTDWGLGFGGGVTFGGARGLFVEARYALGLKDVSNVSDGFDAKQRVFAVLAGLSF